MNSKRLFCSASISMMVLGAGLMAPALALAAAAPAPAAADDVEAVVVTGTRLAGFDAPTPVTTLAGAELQANNARNVADLITDIPELRIRRNIGQTLIPVGLSQIDLRGLNGVNSSQALANAARNAAMGMGGYNSQGLCATGVSRAIVAAYGIKVWGNGNQIDDNLPRDKFRQIDISLEQALKIPGLVLTWEKTSSAAGSIYGHTAITLGDGHSSASDFIENYTTNNGRSGFKVFMPI